MANFFIFHITFPLSDDSIAGIQVGTERALVCEAADEGLVLIPSLNNYKKNTIK